MANLHPRLRGAFVVALTLAGGLLVGAQNETQTGEWRSSGGDSSYKRYSPLAQITRDNVKNLRIAWRHAALDPQWKEQFPKLRTNNYLRATPTMIGGVLYGPDSAGLIEAIDAATGEMIWRQDPGPDMASDTNASSPRGVDFWKGGSDYRLFTVRNGYLYALDLRGRPVAAFGTDGRSSVVPPGARSFGWSSGPIVVGDVVVVAGNLDGAGDGGTKWKNSPPEDVRGFDARTGKLLWTFHVVPHEGEFGADTWGDGSGKLSGDLGSWCCISADEQLGYVKSCATHCQRAVRGARLQPCVSMLCGVAMLAVVASAQSSGGTVRDGVYNAEQARRGRTTYDGKCASCHDGGTMGPELWGEAFLANWNGKSLNAFFTRIQTTMPEDAPGSLSENDALDVIAYVVQTNGFPAGDKALPTASALSTVTFVSNK